MTTTSEQVQQRSDLIGTQVITRDTGKKLGVITQLWVDVDQREVMGLSLRDTLISGTPRQMLLSSIRRAGDVILVDDEDAIEDMNVLNYSSLVGSEVVTETGELLGKVRGFKFDISTGQISSLVIASIGIPLIPAQLISTYELPVEEVVSSGPERLIVFEGAEERLNQLTVGLLERLGISGPPWEREEEEEYLPTASTANQLGSGIRTTTSYPAVRPPVRVEETWEDEGWEEEPEPVPVQRPRQQRAMKYYEPEPEPAEYYNEEEYEDEVYEEEYEEPAPAKRQYVEEDDTEYDAWADAEPQPYKAPQVNFPEKMPEKMKAPEYDQEPDY
jgi:sporulation protein YlmC with PRC-barrel domain